MLASTLILLSCLGVGPKHGYMCSKTLQAGFIQAGLAERDQQLESYLKKQAKKKLKNYPPNLVAVLPILYTIAREKQIVMTIPSKPVGETLTFRLSSEGGGLSLGWTF